jgi:hypothetical protein
MKPSPITPFFLLVIGLTLCVLAHAQNAEKKLDVESLEAVPDGNYLVTLELNGKQERMNFKIEKNRARCMNSTDPNWKGAQGQFMRFQQGGAGMFEGRFRLRQGGATQLWIFRPDGIAAIREAPDRGEIQSAVPVKGDSIEPPKGK